jgi:hypothetical protein
MRSVVVAFSVGLTAALSACGDDSGEKAGVIQPKGPDPNAVSPTGAVHIPVVTIRNSRAEHRFSKRACRLLGPARVAYENNEAGTVREIARRWVERTAGRPAWRQAAFAGCIAGFAARSGKRAPP